MKSRFLLDIVVSKSAIVFKLFASEDKTLLIGRNAFFILNFLLDAFNRIRRFNGKSNGLTSKCFDEYLHLYGSTLEISL